MIKRMELRFTIVAISVMSTVLLIILILVNVISLTNNIRNADQALEHLAASEMNDVTKGEVDKKEGKPPGNLDDNQMEPPVGDVDLILAMDKERIRSYKIVLDDQDLLVDITGNILNQDEETKLYDLALSAMTKSREFGFVDEYRYMVSNGKDQTTIMLLDYSFERQSELSFIYVSIGVFMLAIALVTGLVKIFMKPVMKPIRESYLKQKQFITDASHELKTPLTIISTNNELIEMDGGASKWTKSIKNQVGRLRSLSNELVTLSRMDEEQKHIVMREVNVTDIVNDVVMGFESTILANGNAFSANIEEDIKTKGNYDALEKVLSILLHNASKYVDKEGSVEVNLYKKGKAIHIQVSNTTDFIGAGNHEEFFDRFYRSDASRNSKTGGFGIGLAVAQTIIEEHHGKIRANSRDGYNLEVMISL